MPSEEKIELKSEELQEVLGRQPGWLIRWGISLIFIILGFLLLLSWLVKYPDIINARVVVTTAQNAASIIPQTSGKLVLRCNDLSGVSTNQLIGYIENSADVDAVMKLSKSIRYFLTLPAAHFTYEECDSLMAATAYNNLGEIQPYVSDLRRALSDLNAFYTHNSISKQVKGIEVQQVYYTHLNEQLLKQTEISQSKYALRRKRLDVDSQLMREKVLAPLEVDNTRQSFLESVSALEDSKAGIINSRIQELALGAQKEQLLLTLVTTQNSLLTTVRNALSNVNSRVDDWKQKYLLFSPYSGVVNFASSIFNNQFVSPGVELMRITPIDSNVICKAVIPVSGSGKIEIGQRVIIKLDNYPFSEYGSLDGTVKNISAVPVNNLYNVTISLSNKLVTNYHKTLTFHQEMQGSAGIITRDMRFIERIFYQLRMLADNKMN